MTRSIFDPTGGETEHSGSQNLGPDASEISQMPPDIVDGVVDLDEDDEDNVTIDMSPAEASPPLLPLARRTDSDDVDAPQEAEAMDDPGALLEGQSSDDCDAPQ